MGVFGGYPSELRNIPTSLGVKGQNPLDLCSRESISLTFQYGVFSLQVENTM